MPAGYAPRLPLRVDPVDGPYGLLRSQLAVARQNFKMLLLTIPGERMMDPGYGVGLKQYLFESNTPTTHAVINDRIVEQVKRYMNYIQLNRIDFSTPQNSPDLFPYTLSVSINFTIPGLQTSTTLQIDFEN